MPSQPLLDDFKTKAQYCEACQAKRASSYCTQCAARFCSSCDRKNHVGALEERHARTPFVFKEESQSRPFVTECSTHPGKFEDQWCKFCRIFVCEQCLQNYQHRNHLADVAEQNEIAERHKRLLQEQVLLLKHKIADGALFLRNRIAFRFDKELQALLSGRLKDEFEKLHMLLRQTQEALARDSLTWKERMMPEIEKQIGELEKYFEKSAKLVTDGELALFQSPAYFMEGAKGQALLSKLRDRNEFDVLGRIAALEKAVTFSDFNVYGGASVDRAIRRIFIAPREVSLPDDISSQADREEYVPMSEEMFDKLDFTGVYRLSHSKCTVRWESKYSPSVEIEDDTELRRLVKNLVEDDLLENHQAPHDYIRRLTMPLHTDQRLVFKWAKAFEKDLVDAMLSVFENLVSRQEQVYYDLKSRARRDDNRSRMLHRDDVASAWAGYMEKQIEVGVRAMLAQKEKDAARRDWLLKMGLNPTSKGGYQGLHSEDTF